MSYRQSSYLPAVGWNMVLWMNYTWNRGWERFLTMKSGDRLSLRVADERASLSEPALKMLLLCYTSTCVTARGKVYKASHMWELWKNMHACLTYNNGVWCRYCIYESCEKQSMLAWPPTMVYGEDISSRRNCSNGIWLNISSMRVMSNHAHLLDLQ